MRSNGNSCCDPSWCWLLVTANSECNQIGKHKTQLWYGNSWKLILAEVLTIFRQFTYLYVRFTSKCLNLRWISTHKTTTCHRNRQTEYEKTDFMQTVVNTHKNPYTYHPYFGSRRQRRPPLNKNAWCDPMQQLLWSQLEPAASYSQFPMQSNREA